MVGSLRSYGNDNIVESTKFTKSEMVIDEKIYVAVTGKDLESKSSLVWAILNTGGKEFCIVYVHQPIHGPKSRLYTKEKEKANKNLDKYLRICRQMQVIAEKIYIEMDSIEKGILQLISQYGVRKLVMGAASDRHYSMKMRDLQSKKAIYIHREAPTSCQIWFTCHGYLICSREARRRDNLFLEYVLSNSLNQPEIGIESVTSSSIVKYDDHIQVAVAKANDSNLKVSKYEEAKKLAINAIKGAKQTENVYFNELKCRKDTKKALSKAREELEKLRSEYETRITKSNMVISKLQEKYSSSMEALRRLREEQEQLKIELREVSTSKNNHKNHERPHYFICPITQDVMKDPHVAADGFTYEGEAISNWFERGHETSPMTNKGLPHTSLVPNLALRSAIQEWLQDSTS